MIQRYANYARALPNKIACRDPKGELTWQQLDELSNLIATRLIDMGIHRDAPALIQIKSSTREMILRVALKKAGIIGCFVPIQWRSRELDYSFKQINPSAMFFT